jgi:hypothetical protein
MHGANVKMLMILFTYILNSPLTQRRLRKHTERATRLQAGWTRVRILVGGDFLNSKNTQTSNGAVEL